MDKAEARNLDGSLLVIPITILRPINEMFTLVSKHGEEQRSPFKAT
ncbi:MAG TPA: hypothetical protein VEQ18_01420 [Candidatus Nitrosocosmicus sp.]|nr:hypothetical protein [Candidatus Nitrosocosmicus sp.]